jgi:hypothetical protein
VCLFDDFFGWIDRTQHIRHMGKRNQARLEGEQSLIFTQIEQTIRCNRNELQAQTPLSSQHLPGYQVRMVFHFRQDDKVSASASPPPEKATKLRTLWCWVNITWLAGGLSNEQSVREQIVDCRRFFRKDMDPLRILFTGS